MEGSRVKVLLAHNFYGSSAPSGENQVFELEKALLERNGHEVTSFTRTSDRIRASRMLGPIRGALATPWNPWTGREIAHVVSVQRPDVVHAHNTFPLISPSIFSAVGHRAARVLTLHNYRLFCPSAIPLRDGRTCTECLDGRTVRPSLRHGCYRGSRLATLPLAAGVALHRALRLWDRHVDAFIALSEFQRDLMVRAGLPKSRVWVKPNFYPGTPAQVPWSERENSVVFVGRLSEEKGVGHLLDAWLAWGSDAPELRIVGDGPLRQALEVRAKANAQGRITFLGQVPAAEAEAEIARARLLVLPSVWFEGFPMVLREAFAFGTPAAVSDIGPLPRIVQDGRTGVVFRPGDQASLLAVVRTAWEQADLGRMSDLARREFEENYAEAANHLQLMAIYRQAIAVQKERLRS
jgi:glycosyltransferase involved in cell wall biosynthesis